jgi:GLPGLI family protein
MAVVDTTRIRVWYAFNADDVKDENTYIDHQRLDIGKRVTKYYSEFLFRSDSLIVEWKKAHPGAEAVPGFLGNGGKKQDKWSEYEYSDLFISNGELTEYATMPLSLVKYNSYYTEPYPLQQWTMGTETQDILGHRCQKATCHWRGRDFVAWFAPDIPVKAGPWKFGGLPGLILKLQDTAGIYRFEAVQISSKPSPIYKYDFKAYRASTREKVWKMQKTFNENWFKAADYHKASVDAAGNVVVGEAVSKFTPYSPLELE